MYDGTDRFGRAGDRLSRRVAGYSGVWAYCSRPCWHLYWELAAPSALFRTAPSRPSFRDGFSRLSPFGCRQPVRTSHYTSFSEGEGRKILLRRRVSSPTDARIRGRGNEVAEMVKHMVVALQYQ